MTLVNIETDVDVQGVTLAERIEMLRQYPTYVGHDCKFVPVMHETHGKVGGWQVHHGACCPGRVDAHVTPKTYALKTVEV